MLTLNLSNSVGENSSGRGQISQQNKLYNQRSCSTYGRGQEFSKWEKRVIELRWLTRSHIATEVSEPGSKPRYCYPFPRGFAHLFIHFSKKINQPLPDLYPSHQFEAPGIWPSGHVILTSGSFSHRQWIRLPILEGRSWKENGKQNWERQSYQEVREAERREREGKMLAGRMRGGTHRIWPTYYFFFSLLLTKMKSVWFSLHADTKRNKKQMT